MNDLFLRACRREPVERPPVWMMRQAGRYLPEYRAVRERADFLTMVRHAGAGRRSDAAAGGPARRGRRDHLQRHPGRSAGHGNGALGGGGHRPAVPSAAPLAGRFRVACATSTPRNDLGYVLDALRLARRELDGRVPLIGFAGAPWTLMSYMVEGAGVEVVHARQAAAGAGARHAPTRCSRGWRRAVGRVPRRRRSRPGAQAVQLFDSWASALGPRDFREFALPYLAEAVRIARRRARRSSRSRRARAGRSRRSPTRRAPT